MSQTSPTAFTRLEHDSKQASVRGRVVVLVMGEGGGQTNYLGGELQVNLGLVGQAPLQLGPGLPQSAGNR